MQDMLLLRSNDFSFEPTETPLGLADLPLGNDLAEYLKLGMERADGSWRVLDPCLEDFGSVLLCYRGDLVFDVTISWLSRITVEAGEEDVWLVQFGQSHGCWSLFRKPPDDEATLRDLRELVHDVAASRPDVFHSVERTSWDEIDAEDERRYQALNQLWKRWARQADPRSPRPVRWGCHPDALGSRAVYVGQYAHEAFEHLGDFAAFCWYTSTAQAEILRAGPTGEMPSSFRPPLEATRPIFPWTNRGVVEESYVLELIGLLTLPSTLEWILDIRFARAFVEGSAEFPRIRIVAETAEGWFQLFVR